MGATIIMSSKESFSGFSTSPSMDSVHGEVLNFWDSVAGCSLPVPNS